VRARYPVAATCCPRAKSENALGAELFAMLGRGMPDPQDLDTLTSIIGPTLTTRRALATQNGVQDLPEMSFDVQADPVQKQRALAGALRKQMPEAEELAAMVPEGAAVGSTPDHGPASMSAPSALGEAPSGMPSMEELAARVPQGAFVGDPQGGPAPQHVPADVELFQGAPGVERPGMNRPGARTGGVGVFQGPSGLEQRHLPGKPPPRAR
jgi:hypothetical protein